MSLAFFCADLAIPTQDNFSQAGSPPFPPPPPLLCKICFVVVRHLKPPNFEKSGNLLSFSNINGQLVRRLLKDSLFYVLIDYSHDICKNFASMLCYLCENICKVIIFYATLEESVIT